MPRSAAKLETLTNLLDRSERPIYAIDARRRIVYCNPALATWLAMETRRVVGRLVEYHSEPSDEPSKAGEEAAPLTDLCPPPRALAGEPCSGMISCVTRDGGLAHRHAEFVPVSDGTSEGDAGRQQANEGVVVFLSSHDLSPHELTTGLTGEASADELHRTIRRFRRAEAGRYAIETLLGDSTAMRKVRDQVIAAAASGANTLVCGQPGSGKGHIGRAIHYRAVGDAKVKLVPIDCELANEDLLRRAVDAIRQPGDDPRQRPTLLLENLDRLAAVHQSQLLTLLQQNALPARIIATVGPPSRGGQDEADTVVATATSRHLLVDLALLDAVSTITIRVPRLTQRIDDLPILAQFFVEQVNRGREKQVGRIRPDALDLLALYSWPGEIDELRQVIAIAHRTARSHEIVPGDLPPVIRHASQSAARIRRQPERIVLDELLANIEREAIMRALAQAGSNKTEAAELLGLTRPRLYRRLVQLGLVSPATDELGAVPEFIEEEPTDKSP